MSRVVIAMSGGVDSSVAAALLRQQGHEVIGMMMRLWSEPGCDAANRCCTPDAMALARRVAAKLDIPFYAVDAQQAFRDSVVSYFLEGYTSGETPNPCLACNRHLRFGFLLQQALTFGADYLATGHYARLQAVNGRMLLTKGRDPDKDQSYVLSVMTQSQARQVLFPLGDYTKPQIRQIASELDLPTAKRADSQDLCFLGSGDYRQFLARHVSQRPKPGPIVTRAGKQLGEHQGLWLYTIGQRKGLNVPSLVPLYVLAKDQVTNTLVVGPTEERGRAELCGRQVNWLSGEAPSAALRAGIKVRYQSTEILAEVTPLPQARVHVRLDMPANDIAPGQGVVFYDGDVCLGCGVIE